METSKCDIINSRSIGFGSSDAKDIASVGKNGKLNKAVKNRLSYMLFAAEKKHFSTKSTRYGDYIESEVFASIKNSYPEYKINSNPFYEVETTYKFKCFNHIDIEVLQPVSKRVIWFEVKATNDTLEETIKKYKYQLCWHWWVLSNRYVGYDKELYLVHYHTKDKTSTFDPEKLTIVPIEFDYELFKYVLTGLEIVNGEIDSFTPDEEIVLCDNLPHNIDVAVNKITDYLMDIKRLESEMSEFKDRLHKAMIDNRINKIDLPQISINRVDESETIKFNQSEFMKSHPKIYKKFLQPVKRKGYINIKIKNHENKKTESG